jgi:hypothetical protein
MTISGTEKTLSVKLDANTGEFIFSGVSIPENSVSFFEPIKRYINKYIENPQKITTVIFRFEYLNSGSLFHIFKILEQFNELQSQGKSNVLIRWQYDADDTDIESLCEDFQDTFDSLIIEKEPIN